MFTYENWLSSTKGPKRIKVCELPAVVDDEEMVEKTTYVIQVQTSDLAGVTHCGLSSALFHTATTYILRIHWSFVINE